MYYCTCIEGVKRQPTDRPLKDPPDREGEIVPFRKFAHDRSVFVKTAVARQDLAAAWKISGPNVRGGLTYKEWLTGAIPVIPYPIKLLAVARFKIDYSYRDQALIEVALLPKDGASIKPQTFFLGLKRVAGSGGKPRWVVDSWVPRASTLVPQPAN